MSSTSAADLLDHADLLTRQLRASELPASRTQWESMDVTVYRLLHELLGAEPFNGSPGSQTLIQVLRAYPAPLGGPPEHRQSVARAASLAPEDQAFRRRVQHGNLHLVHDGGAYLPPDAEDRAVTPADFSDPHPLARLACTLGAVADLVVCEREAHEGRLMDNAQLAGTCTHVLSLTYVAARYALTHSEVVDATRPLAVAQYAESALEALRPTAERPLSLVRMASTAPEPAPSTLNERLEAAVDHWVRAADAELTRLIPSTEVLRAFANQGAHLYAATHRLLQEPAGDPELGEDARAALSKELATGEQTFRAADRAWGQLTNASRPSHEFFASTRELYDALTQVRKADHQAAPDDWAPQRALRDLDKATQRLSRLMETARPLPDQLLRSGLLFAPARTVHASPPRLSARNRGVLVHVTPDDCTALREAWPAAAHQALAVAALWPTLEPAARQAAPDLLPDLR
jgi:hypothetical protein